MRVDETIALAALIQAVTVKLYKLIRKNLGFRLYRRLLINENKWRAARYGISGKLIDFGKQEEVECASLIHELLEFVDDVVDELGSREEIDYIQRDPAQRHRGRPADRRLPADERHQGRGGPHRPGNPPGSGPRNLTLRLPLLKGEGGKEIRKAPLLLGEGLG